MGIREILKGNKSKELPSESATSNDITDRVALDLFVYGALDDLYTVYLIKPKSSDLGYSVLRLESAHELSDLIKRSGYGYSESSYNKCATLDSWSTENLKALLQL